MTNPTRSSLTAADVLTADPRTCSVYSSVLEAALIFRDANCGVVPVVDGGQPLGTLTARDVAVALAMAENDYLAAREVEDFMTKDVVSVAPGDSLESVATKFGAQGLHRLLVVDSGEILRGIIAWSDVASHLPDQTVGQFVSEADQQPKGTDWG